jgi:hypothetical protein
MSARLYEARGPDKVALAFCSDDDGTHHNGYGAYEPARNVVEGIKSNVPALAERLLPGTPPFDPDHPDPAGQVPLID